jgi:hypothetical protein
MYSRKQNKYRKHYRRHGKTCKCRKCCKKMTKRMRHRSRSRRGGSQTAVGGDMMYKGGQWISTNPAGGRS